MSWLDEYAVKPLSIARPTRTVPLTERLESEPRRSIGAIGFTAELTAPEDDEGD
jgi:hypothetical protein